MKKRDRRELARRNAREQARAAREARDREPWIGDRAAALCWRAWRALVHDGQPRTGTVVAAIAGLAAVQLALLRPLFAAGEPYGDDLSIHLAEIGDIARALRSGDLALWSSSGNLGFASGYYYQLLPQLFVALPAALLGPDALLPLFKLGLVLPLMLLPWAGYRALRLLGFDRTAALGGAAAAGLVFGRSPWSLGIESTFTAGVFTQPWAMPFFLLALAHAGRFLQAGKGLTPAVGHALLSGMCHPFIAFCLAVVIPVGGWWRGGRQAAVRALALAVAVLAASACLWLPVLVHYDAFGGFPARPAGETGLRPAELLPQIWNGDLLDAGRARVLTVMLLLAAVVAVRRRNAPLVTLGARAAALGALVMLGPYLGTTEDDLLPAIRFLAPMQLLLGLFAGAGGVMAIVALVRRWSSPTSASIPAVALAMVVGFGLVAFASDAHVASRVRVVSGDDHGRDELQAAMQALASMPRGRIWSDATLGTPSHWWQYLPAAYVGAPALRAYGGAALQSSPNFVYLREFEPQRHAALVGLRYVLAQKGVLLDIPGVRVAWSSDHYVLFELAATNLFAPVSVIGSVAGDRQRRRRETLEWFHGFGAEHGQHLLVGDNAPPARSAGALVGAAKVIREWQGPSRHGAQVEVTRTVPVTFRVSVSWHPGWHASVDGKAVPTLRLTPDILGVEVGPGSHTVELRFRRPWWTWALFLFSALVLLTARIMERNPPIHAAQRQTL